MSADMGAPVWDGHGTVDDFAGILEVLSGDQLHEFLKGARASADFWLEFLERYPDDYYAVALVGSLPDEVMRVLARHWDFDARDEMVSRPDCPTDIHQMLMNDEAMGIRKLVAGHLGVGLETVWVLTHDHSGPVRKVASERLAAAVDVGLWPPVVVPELPRGEVFSSADDFLAVVNLTDAVEWGTRLRWAQASESVWLDIVDRHPDWGFQILHNHCLPESVLRRIVLIRDPDHPHWVADRLDCPERLLAELACHPDRSARLSAAENPSASCVVLGLLAGDPLHVVRVAAVEQLRRRCGDGAGGGVGVWPPVVSVECVEDFAAIVGIEDQLELGVKLRGARATTQVWLQICEQLPDAACDVLHAVDVPVEVLRVLASHESAEIRHRVASRAETPADVLHQLAQDPGDWVRWEVVFHPSTTRETVTGLVNDFCGCTREAAQARLDSWDNYSTEALARFYCAEAYEAEGV